MGVMAHREPNEEKRQIPSWLLGLIIAAALFVIGLWAFTLFGFGDDPVIEQILLPNVLGPAYRISAARVARWVPVTEATYGRDRE